METIEQQIGRLIDDSIREDRTVETAWSTDLHEALLVECDDWIELDAPTVESGYVDYWGRRDPDTELAADWRIRLERGAK
jgi:hypothetical protein